MREKRSYMYRCKECELTFFPEEAARGRFSIKHGLCARCLFMEKAEAGEFKLPGCFGSYDGGNLLCTSRCGASQGCVVHYVDRTAYNWSITPRGDSKSGPTYREILVRGLRILARPVHVMELAVILHNSTRGRWGAASGRAPWRRKVIDIIKRADHAFPLGDGFYIWLPAWDFERTDSVGHVPLALARIVDGQDRKELLSPQEIVQQIWEDENK